jgi:hypothetical protein
MRAVFVSMFVLAAGMQAGVAAPTSTAIPASGTSTNDRSAPADQYFGAFGMSPLSIRSTIGFLGRQYHYRTISDHDLLRKALMAEDALQKWRSAYPDDPWLAPTYFHLEQLYQAVQSDEARKHATAILKVVVRYFPDSKQGHLSRARLAAGFPPLVAESPLVTPSPSADAAASKPDSVAPSPAAGLPSPAAAALPSPGGAAASETPSAPAASPTAAPAASPSSH